MAIIDEVDSMLVDDSSKIARLSSSTAGMDLLQPVYVNIWVRLNKVLGRFVEFEDKTYFFEGDVIENEGIYSV